MAPTLFEYLVLKAFLPRASLTYAGMRLARGVPAPGPVIVCGLAGGLDDQIPPGAVIVPEEVATEDGRRRSCDPQLVAILGAAARWLGSEPCHDPLLTSRTLVTGADRQYWCDRGFAACDMETGLLPAHVDRFATIRIILDTPQHSISEEWTRAARALRSRRLWGELGWLAVHAPRFAVRAALITRTALPRLEAYAAGNRLSVS